MMKHLNKFNLIYILIFFSVELELENEHGEFLEQCKSHFVNIESKSYKLRQEIRRLRIEMGLPTFQSQERKVCSKALTLILSKYKNSHEHVFVILILRNYYFK